MGLKGRMLKRGYKKEESGQRLQDKSDSTKTTLHSSLSANFNELKESLGDSSDIIMREFQFGFEAQIVAGIIYVDGLADTKSIHNFILETLMLDFPRIEQKEFRSESLLTFLKSKVLTTGDIKNVEDFDHLYESLLSGDVILLVDGYVQGFIISMRGWESRSVTEASTETIIRGPKESFVENIRTNTALIRRRIKDPRLRIETSTIGKVTRTNVSLMYIKGIVNDEVVAEVRERLNRIDIDGILDSGYIEQMVQDDSITPFPTVYNTERPDVVAADLLEGRVAILVDGTPYVLIVPALFIQFFQAAEDYYHRTDIATLLRILRFIGFFIAFTGPSLYIAITTFHQEMIPTPLLLSLMAQRESVPFPAFIEAIFMEVAFEILREAGIRMPRAIGQAVSIVGTLVVGTAAVEAGMVSAAMVIVVSITAISNFVFPSISMAIPVRILRFPLMALAASFGLIGMVVGMIILVLHLCSLRSFGVPYMSPFAPLVPSDMKDTFVRAPWWSMFARPRLISKRNVVRGRTPQPEPPKTEE